MYHLKLKKGLSFDADGIHATAASPDFYTEDEGKYHYALESGYFAKAGGTEEAEETPDTAETLSGEEDEKQEDPVAEEIQGMTKAQLTEYAEKNGIDISGCKTKDEISSKIADAIAKADEARAALREE